MTLILRFAAMVMVAMAIPALGASPIRFQFEQIPTFDEPNPETLGLALAINELGESVGIADDAQFIARGFLYKEGQFSEIPGFEPDLQSHPQAINQFGDVAGGAGMRVTSGGHTAIITLPFVQASGGPIRSLLTAQEIASGMGGMAWTLNDSGSVAFEGPGAVVGLANGERVAWGFQGGGIIATGRINQLGQLVGTGLRPGASGFEALIYDLRNRDARTLHDPGSASMSFAVDVNNSGVAVGEWNRNDNNRTVPVIWRNGQGEQLPFVNEQLAGWIGRATAINDRGDVLGESSSANGERVDWLLLAGETVPLNINDLIDESSFAEFDAFMAFDINNSREIAGAAIARDAAHPLGSTNKPGILLPTRSQAPPFPAPGLWADLSKPGSGFEINRVGDRHYLVWTTYEDNGMPVWYFSETVRLVRDGWKANLLKFSRDSRGAITSVRAGEVVLSSRSTTQMLFSWRLDGASGSAVYRYLAGTCEAGALGHTGTWFDPASPGFGLSLLDLGLRQAAVFYFYDLNGNARWVFLNFPSGPGLTEAWLFNEGSCPGCAYRSPRRNTIGTAQLGLGADTIELQVNLAGSGGLAAVAWNSDNQMLRIPTPPSCQD
ncbi:MAG: hypothetical protein R3212_05915 [Xanthomonadales bacterium]|nr:hypothetical protein [Xanthomonadales bacterium]